LLIPLYVLVCNRLLLNPLVSVSQRLCRRCPPECWNRLQEHDARAQRGGGGLNGAVES